MFIALAELKIVALLRTVSSSRDVKTAVMVDDTTAAPATVV